jgi:DNA repair protein RadC
MRVRELRIAYLPRSDLSWNGRQSLTSPQESASLLMSILQNEPVEVFGLLCLNSKHRVLCYHELSRGTLDATLVHPREIFKAALLANAAAVIVAHNHPSGDPTPSPDDTRLTERVIAAGVVMGIDVLDHVIVADNRYFSFREGRQL